MIVRILRVLAGFVLACLAAGLTTVFFIYPPFDAAGQANAVALLALAAATHSAVFAAPIALVGVAYAEWRGINSWIYYVLLALAIALAGFLAEYAAESPGPATIANNYALTAFLTTGFVAGVVYWMVAGRYPGTEAETVYPPRQMPDARNGAKNTARNVGDTPSRDAVDMAPGATAGPAAGNA